MDEILTCVIDALDWMDPPPVFVGGATIGLYLCGLEQFAVRPTDDVDLIVATVESQGQWLMLQKDLEERGWTCDVTGPTCRFISPQGIPVDFMARDPTVLGFAGRWYPAAVDGARSVRLSTGRDIRLPTLPCLLACKLEAFTDRGRDDPYISKDLEDIVTLIDGCPGLLDAIAEADDVMADWIRVEIRGLLDDAMLRAILPGHLPRGGDEIGREQRLYRVLETIAGAAR